jgi:hypothetical protein
MTATVRDWLFAGIYLAPCRFANVDAFVAAVAPLLDLDDAVPADTAAGMLRGAAAAVDVAGDCADDEAAARRLIAADLRAAARAPLSRAGGPTERSVVAAAGPVRERLSAAGLDVRAAAVTVGRSLPEPFARSGLAATSVGPADAVRYRVAPGVYLRRSRLRPFYSVTLAAHELVHVAAVTGPPGSTGGSGKGLEEGLAEVLGTCYAAAAVVPRTALRAILVHGRYGAGRPRLWSLYADHIRQAAVLYREFGVAGLAALVNGGRDRIAEAEVAVLEGRHRELDLPRGPGDPTTTWLLDYFCGGLLPSYVVAPLDLLLLDAVRDGASAAEVCATARVPEPLGAERLGQLAASTALFGLTGGVVSASILPRYRQAARSSGQPVVRWLAG